ncbi:MAG: 2OG-Fe(II) oxygenase [Elusimicrobia bacterium]|nr:2OG-Fe(II) oxygenase [Elusimicrobiota bacterium]
MRLHDQGPGWAVYDDWLDPAPLAALRSWLGTCRYFTVGVDGSRGVEGTLAELSEGLERGSYRLLGGRFVVRRTDGAKETKQLDYPSGTPLDAVLEGVEARLGELTAFLGEPEKDWQRLGAGPRLYPKGGGLAEHDDGDSIGTFALYLHERWEPEWGGELEIGGRRVLPAPNRCSFVKGGTPHRVLPVAGAAGAALRVSVIGYARKTRGKAF